MEDLSKVTSSEAIRIHQDEKQQKLENGEQNSSAHNLNSQRQDVESAPALMPCPFCGSGAVVRLENQDETPDDWWYVDCSYCPVQTYPQTTTAEAIRRWNTRADSEVLQERSAYREALETISSKDYDIWAFSECRSIAKSVLAARPITQAGVSPQADNPTAVSEHSPASLPESKNEYAQLLAERDRLLQVLETRAEREMAGLECAMCGAPNSFVISPLDPAVGYCFKEQKAWRITSLICATKGCLRPKAAFGDHCMRCLEDRVNAQDGNTDASSGATDQG